MATVHETSGTLLAARLSDQIGAALGARGERALRLFGAAVAALSSIVLLAAIFVGWYRGPRFCIDVPCGGAAASGWASLGGLQRALLVSAAALGAFPLLAASIQSRGSRWLSALAATTALGAALLVVYRISVAPDPVLQQTRLAGPFVALTGCVGIAGGAIFAGVGHRVLEPVRSGPALAVIAAGATGVVVSLFLPWIRAMAVILPEVAAPLPPVRIPPLPGLTAWQAFASADVLLALCAIAILLGTAVALVCRCRAALLVLAGGGWLIAATAVAAAPHAAGVTSPTPFRNALRHLTTYEPGYYVCLGCAGAIVLAGLLAGVAGRRAQFRA